MEALRSCFRDSCRVVKGAFFSTDWDDLMEESSRVVSPSDAEVGPLARPVVSSVRTVFVRLWLSESAFDLGSALISFAIGVWIFSSTGSVQDYSISVLVAALASMAVTPVAGALADRYNRLWVVAGCDLAAIVVTLAIVFLLSIRPPTVGVLYVYSAMAAAIASMRRPAVRVVISAIVPKHRYTQINGLGGISRSTVQIAAPVASAFLLQSFGMQVVVATHFLLVLGGAILAYGAMSTAVSGMGLDRRSSADRSFLVSTRSSLVDALSFLGQTPLMGALIAYGAFVQCLLVLATVMLTPMVLSTHSSEVLGAVMSIGVVGALCGSVMAASRVIRKHLVMWMLLSDAVQSAAILAAGVTDSPVVWSMAAFVCLFSGSASLACSSALWMRKTPLARQGSIFSILAASNLLVMCLVLLIGSRLVDSWLEPALRDGGAWSATIGAWFGTGKGRGIGFLLFVAGLCGLAVSGIALSSSKLRKLETLVPERSD